MPRRWKSIALALAYVALASAAQAQAPGQISWMVTEREAPARGEVQFTITTKGSGSRSMTSHPVALAELQGLTTAQLSARSAQTVRFRLVRDAGVLSCEGSASRGKGIGDCDFQDSVGFARVLQQRGFGAPKAGQLFTLALHDVGGAYIDELARQRMATVSVDDLVRASQHGVTLGYLRAMQRYRAGSLVALVRTRDHGVDPDFIGELAALGYRDLPLDALVRARDHGVDADYIRGLSAAGYRGLPMETLVRMRDHGVDVGFARRANAGGQRLEPEALIRRRDRGGE